MGGSSRSLTIGPVPQVEAEAKASQVDYLLLRLRQGLLTLPSGVSITSFVEHDGNPPPPAPPAETPRAVPVDLMLEDFKTRYLKAVENSLEATSITTIRIHFRHLIRHFGEAFAIRGLTMGDLQEYINKRTKAPGIKGRKLSAATIRKEIVTLRAAWNWANPWGTSRNGTRTRAFDTPRAPRSRHS